MPDVSPFSRSMQEAAFAGRHLRVYESRHDAKLLLAGASQSLSSVLPSFLLPLPDVSSAHVASDATLLWLNPRQWLLLAHVESASQIQHAMASCGQRGDCSLHDVGARFVGLRVQGAHAAEFLAAGCSLDLRDRKFGVGSSAQTRIEDAPVIVFRRATLEYEVLVERPLAHYLWQWARDAAQEWSDQELE